MSKQNLNPNDCAIIYTGDDPGPLPGENPIGRSLRVIAANPGLRLSPTSRIRLNKIYVIDHDTKVRELGEIAPECMHLLEAYYKGN
jgi:hypothetical protein